MKIQAVLRDKNMNFVREMTVESVVGVIRLDDKHYARDGFSSPSSVYFTEMAFFWADGGEFAPYLAFAADRDDNKVGMEDCVGAFPTFKKALEAGKATGLRVVQILDDRNPHRFYTDGMGWSDGRP